MQDFGSRFLSKIVTKRETNFQNVKIVLGRSLKKIIYFFKYINFAKNNIINFTENLIKPSMKQVYTISKFM